MSKNKYPITLGKVEYEIKYENGQPSILDKDLDKVINEYKNNVLKKGMYIKVITEFTEGLSRDKVITREAQRKLFNELENYIFSKDLFEGEIPNLQANWFAGRDKVDNMLKVEEKATRLRNGFQNFDKSFKNTSPYSLILGNPNQNRIPEQNEYRVEVLRQKLVNLEEDNIKILISNYYAAFKECNITNCNTERDVVRVLQTTNNKLYAEFDLDENKRLVNSEDFIKAEVLSNVYKLIKKITYDSAEKFEEIASAKEFLKHEDVYNDKFAVKSFMVVKDINSLINQSERFKQYDTFEEYVYEKMRNNTLMNLIDIGKTEFEKNTTLKESVMYNALNLEVVTMENKLNKKLISSMTSISNTLNISDIEDGDFNLDILGGNDVLERLKVLDVERFDVISKKITNKWSIYGEIDVCNWPSVVGFRSKVHKKRNNKSIFDSSNEVNNKVNIDLNNLCNLYTNEYYKKLTSNMVDEFYNYDEVINIIETNISNGEVLEHNYLPRFNNIAKALINGGYEIYDDVESHPNSSVAREFLLREIYNTKFKQYINKREKFGYDSKDVYELWLKVNKMNNDNTIQEKKILAIPFNKNINFAKNHKVTSVEISKGNSEFVKSYWNMIIAEEFNTFIANNFKELLVFPKANSEIESFDKLQFKLDFEISDFDTTILLIAALLPKKEISEIRNVFVSYLQFLKVNDKKFNQENINESFEKLSEKLKNTLTLLKVLLVLNPSSAEITYDEFKYIITRFVDDSEENIKEKYFQAKGDKIVNTRFMDAIYSSNASWSKNKRGELTNSKVKVEEVYKNNKVTNVNMKYKDDLDFREILSNVRKVGVKNYSFKVEEEKKLVTSWLNQKEIEFHRNSVDLFVPMKINNFINDVYSVLFKLVYDIEKDLVYAFSGYLKMKDLKGVKTYEEIQKHELFKEFITTYMPSLKAYFEIDGKVVVTRNYLAHFNYFQDNNNKSLEYIYNTLHNDYLVYNIKRKKALRESIEYIFEQNDLTIKTSYASKNTYSNIKSKAHSYAYKNGKNPGRKVYLQLPLKTDAEVKLFKAAFEQRK